VETKQTNQIVAQAVHQAYEDWAAQHPTLAGVINHTTLTYRTVERLRDSEEYRNALDAYHRSGNETALLKQLSDLAGPILLSLLAG